MIGDDMDVNEKDLRSRAVKKIAKYTLQLSGVSLFAYAGSMGVVNIDSQVLSISGLIIFFYGFSMKLEDKRH